MTFPPMKAGRRIFAGAAVAALFVAAFLINKTITTRPAVPAPERASDTKPMIAATVAPLGSLAEQVVGDRFAVVALLPAGASPHTFEPQPGDIAKAQGVVLLLENGSGLDPWAAAVVPESVPRMTATNLPGLERAAFPEGSEEQEEHGVYDPHVWLSPRNAGVIVLEFAERLATIDPEGAEGFRARANALNEELVYLQDEGRALLASAGHPIRLLTVHDAWRTFALAFGVEIAGSVERVPGSVPSPSELAELSQLRPTLVASEPQLSETSVQTLTCDLGLPLIELDPEGGTPGRERYQDLIRSNVEAIRTAQSAPSSCL